MGTAGKFGIDTPKVGMDMILAGNFGGMDLSIA
jgi:hypothetical protein